MKKINFNLLTSLFFLLAAQDIYAGIVKQTQHDTHLRWSIQVPKDELSIDKHAEQVLIRSLNEDLLKKIKDELAKKRLDSGYFKTGHLKIAKGQNNVPELTLELKNDQIDIFKFYQQENKRQIIDFWMGSVKETAPKPKLTKKTDIIKTKRASLLKKAVRKTKKNDNIFREKNKKFRDFRYGASFVWDYAPSRPELQSIINLKRKTPEFFYSIEDRDLKDKREVHLQLAINLFKKKKWGLMYKSIKLFQKKHGDTYEQDLIEYLKINALLRENMESQKMAPAKSAVNMLASLAGTTENYLLKKGAYKYLLQYYIDKKQNVKALAIAKKVYTVSREEKDFDQSRYSAEAILYNLSRLGRSDKIERLIKDKNIEALLPFQLRLAYISYALMKEEREEELIKLYNKNKRRLVSPLHSSIVFNVAEAYFRTARYKKAIGIFDRYIAKHAYSEHTSKARVRLALSYDLLGKDINQTIELYKNAIDRSGKTKAGIEAAIRYVALKSVRKKKTTERDREERVLLEMGEDKKRNDKNIKKLIWLVRLRSFIADGKFNEALSYLDAIPMGIMKMYDRNVFLGDGAEIVYGILSKYYNQEEYAKAVNIWKSYKSKYVVKVAKDPYMNLIVGKSYLKLGFLSSMEEALSSFEKNNNSPTRTFPIWSERPPRIDSNSVVSELKIIRHMKLKNWKLAMDEIKKLAKIRKGYNKINYFNGIISYRKKKYKHSIMHLEKFLARHKNRHIDDIELAEILMAYTDSIYQLGNVTKFKRVTKAVLDDVKGHRTINPYLMKVKERIAYLNIEILYGESSRKAYLALEEIISDFNKVYQKSVYSGRVNYLLGMALVSGRKIDDGKKVFSELIDDEKVPEHVKQLARSELSLLRIREKTI